MRTIRHSTLIVGSQIILILLPVLALCFVGIYFLRQDKHLVEREAEERAQEIVAAALKVSRAALTNIDLSVYMGLTNVWPEGEAFFQVDTNQALVFPPPRKARTNSFDPTLLGGRELELWNAAQDAEFRTNDFDGALIAWEGLLRENTETNLY